MCQADFRADLNQTAVQKMLQSRMVLVIRPAFLCEGVERNLLPPGTTRPEKLTIKVRSSGGRAACQTQGFKACQNPRPMSCFAHIQGNFCSCLSWLFSQIFEVECGIQRGYNENCLA